MSPDAFIAELSDWTEYTEVYAGILALLSPGVVVPLFLGVMAGRTEAEKRTAAFAGALGLMVALAVFVLVGPAALSLFGISIAAFQIAGGLLLLLVALGMMRGDPAAASGADGSGDTGGGSAFALGIVPITIPILAGPGAISAVVLFATEHEGPAHRVLVIIVGLFVAATVYGYLRAAVALDRFLTPSVTLVLNKVMGLILAAIAFEFILHGIADHFVQLDIQVHD